MHLWGGALFLATLWATGGAWLLLHLWRSEDTLPSASESWMLKLHGGAAWVLLFLLGAILDDHILEGLRRRLKRASGLSLVGALGLLVLTGYGLYYFEGDALRAVTVWSHRLVGVVSLPLLVSHILRGRPPAP